MVAGIREHKKPRLAHEIGTLSLEGTPIDEKPDVLAIEYAENRSPPVTPITQTETLSLDAHLPRGVEKTAVAQDEQVFVGSIDQGTTSSRFLIFNHEGEPIVNYQLEFDNIYPESG